MAYRLLAVIIIAVLFSSCAGTKTLYNDITLKKSTLEYLYDSKRYTEAKADTIYIANPVISDQAFTAPGKLKKVKAFAIPFLVFNYWESEHTYTLGRNVIKEDVASVIRTSLTEEFNRSTNLTAHETAQPKLTLEIEVDSIGANGPYRSNGHILFILLAYSYSVNESAGPGTAYSSLRYRLKDGSATILEGKVFNQQTTKPLGNGFDSAKDLRHFYASNLTEGLSLSLKSNIESIVKEVESYYLSNSKPIEE